MHQISKLHHKKSLFFFHNAFKISQFNEKIISAIDLTKVTNLKQFTN